MADSTYRPEIDGLRGIAILAVLLHHVDPHLLPGGYVGVDVFFVISGFLITSILVRDLDAGTFSFTHFYARRAKRLIPAATVLVVCLVASAWWFFLPQDFKDFGTSIAAYAAMLSNVLFWKWDDYFAAQNKVWPLLHTWSLAIEEQFYLGYPLLLWALTRVRAGARTAILAAIAIASFALSEWQAHADPRAAYYLLPGRAWELLAGALCTRIPASWCRSRGASTAEGALGIALIAVPAFLYSEATVFPGVAALWPVAGTALLMHAALRGNNVWATFLQASPLVATGLISYSLYLWHWPLIVFAKYPWSAAPTMFPKAAAYAAGLASIVIAALSYRYVETPYRRARVGDGIALLAAACASGLVCVAGVGIRQSRGVPSRLPAEVVAYADGIADFQPRRGETIQLPVADIRAGRLPRIGVRDSSAPPAFVLWGDSHADSLVPVFDALAAERGLWGIVVTRSATPPVIGLSFPNDPGDNRADELIAATKAVMSRRIPVAVLAAHWTAYLEPRCTLQLGEETATDSAAKLVLMERGLRDTVAALRASGAKHIWILEEVPFQPYHVPRALAWARLRGLALPHGITTEEHATRVAQISRMFASLTAPDVSTIDMAPAMLAAPQRGLLTADGRPAYYDRGHVSVAGTALLRPVFEPIFAADARDEGHSIQRDLGP